MHETELTKEQIEAAKLREKYTPKPISPLEKAKLLDRLVTAKARTAAIAIGCLGMTVCATGVACMCTWHIRLLPYGIIVASIGAIMSCFAPVIYRIVKKTESHKVAAEILELTKGI
jgi:hypothetical protein